MDIFRDKLEAMRTSFNLKFQNAFQGVATFYESYCMIEGDPSHTAIEFPFLEQFAEFREWFDERQVKNLASQKLRIVEIPFELTVGIPARDVETDNWRQYANVIAQMGQSGGQLKDDRFIKAVTGKNDWIDSKPFFNSAASGNAARKFGESIIVNATANPFSQEAFEKGYETMQSYTGHKGKPLLVTPNRLTVGPGNRARAWDIIKNTKVVDATGTAAVDNRNKDLVEIDVNPNLVGPLKDVWWLAATGGIVKPIIMMVNKDVNLTVRNQANDDNVFWEGEVIYGADAYINAAPAMPHLIYRGGM